MDLWEQSTGWYTEDSSPSVEERAKIGFPEEEDFSHSCLNSSINGLLHSFMHSTNMEGHLDDMVLDYIEGRQMLS